MLQKDLDSIEETDLVDLIANQVGERRTIDYKAQLNIGNDTDKKEFLADVSSFANADGGDLIIGVAEDRGLPTSIIGLVVPDIDQETLRIEQIIRDGIQARIIGIRLRWVKLNNDKHVLIIRIPRSWNSPHKVSFKGHDKFFGRNSAGKYPYDVSELRSAFVLSESLNGRIKRFRDDRLANVITGDMPVPFSDTPKIVIHMVPISSFDSKQAIDIRRIYQSGQMPMLSSSADHRYNLDGVLFSSNGYEPETNKPVCRSYIQFFKNGTVEAVEGRILRPYKGVGKYLPIIDFEIGIQQFIAGIMKSLRGEDIAPPIHVFITLLGVKELVLSKDRSGFDSDDSFKIDRDVLTLPEAIIDDYDSDVHELLRDSVNTLWNACGYEQSWTYDKNKKDD